MFKIILDTIYILLHAKHVIVRNLIILVDMDIECIRNEKHSIIWLERILWNPAVKCFL